MLSQIDDMQYKPARGATINPVRLSKSVGLATRPAQFVPQILAVPFLVIAAGFWVTSWVVVQVSELSARALGPGRPCSSARFQSAFGLFAFLPMVLAYSIGMRLWELSEGGR